MPSAPSTDRLTPILVQPDSGGRISGGYLYNARMAEYGLWTLRDTSGAELQATLDRIPAHVPVLLDSIWLTPQHATPFLERKARGARVGAMMHSFPSMIDATERAQPPRTQPLVSEVAALEQLDVVVVPGPHYRDLLRNSSARVVIAEPGIEAAWRTAPRPRRGPCRLVSVGSVTARKGFLDVCDALAELDPGAYRWVVAGSLEADPEYAARLRERTLSMPSVEFVGQLRPDIVRETVQQSDVLLMPSYDENHPLVLLEAMAASVPAVAYAAGAARQMLDDGREGWVVPIGDRAAFARCVQGLVSDEGSRWLMANACWKRQRELLGWDAGAARARQRLATAWPEMSRADA